MGYSGEVEVISTLLMASVGPTNILRILGVIISN